MSSILEQCYNKYIEEFPESWIPSGTEEECKLPKLAY